MSSADQAQAAYDKARARSEAVTPGGLHGDPATLSGIRRRGGHRADARRFAAYDAEVAAAQQIAIAKAKEVRTAAQAARAKADAAAPCDIDSLTPGDYLRTRHGWYRVVKVNTKSVTVESGNGWDERIARSKVIETGAAS
jgi:preprotein translocase subunit YajC